LAGAATHPDARGQGVYNTMLKRRLEDAFEQGYRVAMIDAAPMSRRILLKRGFRQIGRSRIFAWMPGEMDMDVINNLVVEN
jgi:predicted acetyltransferase